MKLRRLHTRFYLNTLKRGKIIFLTDNVNITGKFQNIKKCKI